MIWYIGISKHKNSMSYSWNLIEVDVCVYSLVYVVQEIAQHLCIAHRISKYGKGDPQTW